MSRYLAKEDPRMARTWGKNLNAVLGKRDSNTETPLDSQVDACNSNKDQ